jgi:dihydropteroate synthase
VCCPLNDQLKKSRAWGVKNTTMTNRLSQHVPQPGENVLFITGRLAEGVTRRVVEQVSQQLKFEPTVHVVGISVAALMHVDWLLQKLSDEPHGFDCVYLPGWCQGDLSKLSERFGVPFYLGPKDILDLAEYFGQASREQPNLEQYDIEIIAEINHAPRMSERQILNLSNHYRTSGADLIDIGCIPGESWSEVGKIVRLLRQEGFRLSIDSFDQSEVEASIASGAELVLSCNSSNVEWLANLGAEVVVIPDDPAQIETMWETVEKLSTKNCPFRIDPILEPIGFGFAASLARYYEARRNAPDVPIMMGIGNLTEMTEVDSAGVNALFAAICQELNIFSVLATEVIPWCQSAVKEFDLARRLMKHAIENQTLPKHVTSDLVMLRDPRSTELGETALAAMANGIKDTNYRIFVERDQIHIMNRDGYWRGNDAFELFDQFAATNAKLDASHAFYLGYELSKAVTALTLGKQYRQDQALAWGFLTVPEASAHERRKADKQSAKSQGES